MVLALDDELPWDPLWAYVLGEGDERKRKSTIACKKTVDKTEDSGFLSYINDIIPEQESRDESWFSDDKRVAVREDNRAKQQSVGSKGETKRKPFWSRSKRASRSAESSDQWEWHIDTGASVSGEENVSRPNSRKVKLELAQKKVTPSRQSKERPSKSNDEWEWRIDTGASVSSEEHVSRASSRKIKQEVARKKATPSRQPRERSSKSFSSMFRKEPAPSDPWDWQLGSSITGSTNEDSKKPKRASMSERAKESSESWDWPVNSMDSSSKKNNRTNIFKRSKPKEPEAVWTGTEEVVAQMQQSQNSLFDWVGLNGSSSVDDSFDDKPPNRVTPTGGTPARGSPTRGSVAVKTQQPSATPEKIDGSALVAAKALKLEKKNNVLIPESKGFVFGDIFNNWDDLSSSDDSTLHSSSTQDSSAVSTSGYSEDGTKSTHQSDFSSSVVTAQISTDTTKADFTEVRLAYQPENSGGISSNLLPIIAEDGSAEESHFYTDERSCSDTDRPSKDRAVEKSVRTKVVDDGKSDKKLRLDSFNSLLDEVECKTSSLREGRQSLESVSQERDNKKQSNAGRGMCRSVKTLSNEQRIWTAASGVPFHELTHQERSTLFPKVRTVSDRSQNRSSSLILDSQARRSGWQGLAHFQPSLDDCGPQSLYEYEYETGIHMFIVFDRVGVGIEGLKIQTAPIPTEDTRQGRTHEVLIQVEASTVSRTDCYVRHGTWQRKPEPQMPNTPGVDVVGRLYRVDQVNMKRYGLSTGDRVMSLVKWGGNSRFLSVHPSCLVKIDDAVDPALAVCLAETYLAAFQILHLKQSNRIRYQDNSLKQKTVLIIGNAASNMGRAISQLAVSAGSSQMFAMTKKKHFEDLSTLGIEPLDQDSVDSWRELSGKVDLIILIEMELVKAHRNLLRKNGRVVILQNGVKKHDSDCGQTRQKRKTISYDVYEEWDNDRGRCRSDLQHLIKLLEKSEIQPSILDRIALHKVARAQEIVEAKRLTGFIVCEPWLLAKSRAVRL